MKSNPVLYMMLGYPGAGKTTIAEIIAEATGAVHLNSDRIRLRVFSPPKFSEAEHTSLYATLDYLTELILKSGKSVIYDANLNKHQHRQEKYDICSRTGATPRLVWIKIDPGVAKKRATVDADKNLAHRPFGNMDPKTFDRLVQEIEEPKDNEPTTIVQSPGIDKTEIIKALGLK